MIDGMHECSFGFATSEYTDVAPEKWGPRCLSRMSVTLSDRIHTPVQPGIDLEGSQRRRVGRLHPPEMSQPLALWQGSTACE